MSILTVSLTGIFSCIAALVLSRYNKETAIVVILAAAVLMSVALLPQLSELCSAVEEYMKLSGVSSEYIAALLKAVGICFLTQLSADICREQGSAAISSLVELSGKIAILSLALPLFAEVIGMVSDFLS